MRQRADDFDLIIGEERGQILLRCQLEDRQVASIHHVAAAGAALCHEPAEVGVQLGRPARDVDGWNRRLLQRFETQHHRLAGHDLAAIRAGVDVTVTARLVAEFADIDLENLNPSWLQRPLPRARDGLVELAGEMKPTERVVLNLGRRQRQPSREERETGYGPSLHPQLGGVPRICTPCTNEAPPRMAAATWTASVIWSRSAPFSRASRL